MPIPIAALVPLLLGGMYGAGKLEERAEDKRRMERTQQAMRDAPNFIRQYAMAQGIRMPGVQTEQQMEQAAGPEFMETLTQTTPEAPPMAMQAQQLAQQEQPSQGTGKAQEQASQIPAILPEVRISSEGEMSHTFKLNDDYFKAEQKRAFLIDMREGYEQYRTKGLTPRDARNRAELDAGIKNGMPFDPGAFKALYPNMSDAQRYNYARNTAMTALADGLSFDRVVNLLPSRYPHITPEQTKQIANDVFYMRKGALSEYATAVKREEGLQGAELNVEADLLAGQWASEDLEQYLPEKERERLREKVTRVSDINDPAIRDRLMDRYGKSAIVRPGQIAGAEEAEYQENLRRELNTVNLTTIEKAQATIGAAVQVIEPRLETLRDLAMSLNTKAPNFATTLTQKGKLSFYAWAETGFGEMVEIPDGKGGFVSQDMGVVAAHYYDTSLSFLGTMARVFSGERGVLTEQDVDRIKRALPKLGMSKDLTELKMRELMTHIEELKSRAGIGPDPNALSQAEATKLLHIEQGDILHGVKSGVQQLKDMF